jgi:arylsulfatase A-like enzyme
VRAASRGAAWAALRLLVVLFALVAFALWWRREKQPDFVADRRLALMPVETVERVPACNLGGERREALVLPCGRTLRFELVLPGGNAALRFHDGHLSAHPELSVRLLGDGGSTELEHHATSEGSWSLRRVPLPGGAGESCTLELAALDGTGKPGLGSVLISDVVLESEGAGLDESEAAIDVRALDQDLLAQRGGERRFAPPTRESARIGVEGPSGLPLAEDEPLWVTTEPLQPGARLDLALHVGRPWPEAPASQGQVEVLLGERVLGTLGFELPAANAPDAPTSREISGTLDLSEFAGRALDLGLRRSGAPALWVGLRDFSISSAKRVPRTAFVPGSSRNVLLVAVDSLRGDRLGSAGWPGAHTPALDALALRGGRWTHVVAPSSWNLPNLASLLTGLAPHSHGLGIWPRAQLSARLTTLAQSAAWSGLATACFSNSVVTGPQHGLSRGFERLELSELPAPVLAEHALDWLQDASQYRWFLMLDLHDPAFPFEPELRDLRSLPGPPPPALVDRLRKLDSRPGAAEALASEVGSLYDAEVAGVDRALGLLTDWLAARDLLSSTLVVVVGSCGEEFFEHGGRLNGQTLWDEVTRVPLLMAGPGMRAPDGSAFVMDEPISLLDVTRAVGEYGRLVTRSGLQGRLPPPFAPVLPDPTFGAVLRPLPGATSADLDAVRSRRWLWLFDHAAQEERLFDLQADVGATHELLADLALPEAARKEARAEADSLKAAFAEWQRQALLASAAAAEPVEIVRP